MGSDPHEKKTFVSIIVCERGCVLLNKLCFTFSDQKLFYAGKFWNITLKMQIMN